MHNNTGGDFFFINIYKRNDFKISDILIANVKISCLKEKKRTRVNDNKQKLFA